MYRIWSLFSLRKRVGAVVGAVLGVGLAAAVLGLSTPSVTTGGAAAQQAVLPVVMYHGLLPDKARQNTYVIAPALLERDLQAIQRHGYTTVGIQDLLRFTREGKPLPEKAIMLTFDDGYYNNYYYAYPLLQKYGMKAVISPIVRWTAFYSDMPEEQDRPVYSHITWEQIREMTASGLVEIANHSYDLHHAGDGGRHGIKKLSGESEEKYQAMLRQDLQKAQTMLTQKAGVTPLAFTYPFGATSSSALPVLRQLKFCFTFSCEERINVLSSEEKDIWALGRYLRSPEKDSESYFTRIFQAAEQARLEK